MTSSTPPKPPSEQTLEQTLPVPNSLWAFISKQADLRAGFKAHTFLESLGYAWEGLIYATRTQRNFQRHLIIAIGTTALGVALQINPFEWALITAVMGLVLFAELINTALELVVDMLTQGEFDMRAKAIKDMAAGAVLLTAFAALICGVCVFVPKLYDAFVGISI